MAEKRQAFLPADIRKALKAVESGDRKVCAVDFPPEGGFRLLIGEPVAPAVARSGGNEWDEVLSH